MRKSVVAIMFFCFLTQLAEAQLWKMRRFEAVGGLGTAQLVGDIGGFNKKDSPVGFKNVSLSRTRFEINGGLRYRLTQDLDIRFSLTYARFNSSDERGSNPDRGLVAATTIFEPAVIGEYYFIKNKAESSYLFSRGQRNSLGSIFKSLDFYAFAGIGGLSYSVKGNDKLQLLNMQRSGFTAVIPVGLGSSFIFSPDINFGVDLGLRYSLSDYLDGYSSEYSNSKDFYYFLNFSVTYKLKTNSKGFPSFRK